MIVIILILIFSCNKDDFRVIETKDKSSLSNGDYIIVFNDANLFLNDAMQDPNNIRLLQNLLHYRSSRLRDRSNTFMFYTGKSSSCSKCTDLWGDMREQIRNEGYRIADANSPQDLFPEVPLDVKILMLIMPDYPYSFAEIYAFKRFASEGGRIVFMGEHEAFYKEGIYIENQFLLNMGVNLRNSGGSVDCLDFEGQAPRKLIGSSIKKHPLMRGITGLSIGCASVIEPAEGDFPLFYDSTNTYVLGGVAKINNELLDYSKNTILINKKGNESSGKNLSLK